MYPRTSEFVCESCSASEKCSERASEQCCQQRQLSLSFSARVLLMLALARSLTLRLPCAHDTQHYSLRSLPDRPPPVFVARSFVLFVQFVRSVRSLARMHSQCERLAVRSLFVLAVRRNRATKCSAHFGHWHCLWCCAVLFCVLRSAQTQAHSYTSTARPTQPNHCQAPPSHTLRRAHRTLH